MCVCVRACGLPRARRCAGWGAPVLPVEVAGCLTPPLAQDFYFRNSDSPNGVLFEKQQMALRKLLHEFDAIAGHVRRVCAPRGGGTGIPLPV